MLSLFQHFGGGSKMMYRLSVFVTSIYALYQVLTSLGYKLDILTQWLGVAPFFEQGLGWVIPGFVAALAGYGIDKFRVGSSQTNLR